MEVLNDYAGLFALLALIATVVVPIFIYKQQKKEERQKMQDEYDAMMSSARFPMSEEQREFYAKKFKLEKGLKRK
jgi:hypothetical protein